MIVSVRSGGTCPVGLTGPNGKSHQITRIVLAIPQHYAIPHTYNYISFKNEWDGTICMLI